MREIIFDTETTGFRPEDGERIVEIGAVEMVNRTLTGKTFHEYLNPEGRQVNPGALEVHGLTDEFLAKQKTFSSIADEFLEFIDGAHLVAHNAKFDMNFVNHELGKLGKPAINDDLVIDTLQIARKKHPMAQNSLDRLCDRYKIDNSARTKHGALLDSELLAEVYIELLGGRQSSLELESLTADTGDDKSTNHADTSSKPKRPTPLKAKISEEELKSHNEFVESLGEKAIWKQHSS
ncbi:MAG: DNA polymerase III subunit epsilon [Nitratireductor sp.]